MINCRKIYEFLALRRNTSLLLVTLLLAGTGEKLWLGFAPKYIETLGGSILIIGLFDALQTFLGAIYAYPGGWLTDHWGQRKSLLLFSAVSIAGYVLVLVWQSWLALLLGSFLFLAWSALSLPATFSVVATSLESNRHTMGIGVQSMVRRVPMMLGPLIGGWLLTRFGWTDGVRYALALCISDEPAHGGISMVHVRARSRVVALRRPGKKPKAAAQRAALPFFSASSNPSRPRCANCWSATSSSASASGFHMRSSFCGRWITAA